MASLKEQVLAMVPEGEELKPEEFSNLILDDLDITELNADDKKFIEGFTNMELFAMNSTGIKNLNNMPDAPKLLRVEMNDNYLSGNDLKNLLKYPELRVIKFGNNNVKDLDEIQQLVPLAHIMNLDFSENPVTMVNGYKEEMWKLFPGLLILDGLDKEG